MYDIVNHYYYINNKCNITLKFNKNSNQNFFLTMTVSYVQLNHAFTYCTTSETELGSFHSVFFNQLLMCLKRYSLIMICSLAELSRMASSSSLSDTTILFFWTYNNISSSSMIWLGHQYNLEVRIQHLFSIQKILVHYVI